MICKAVNPATGKQCVLPEGHQEHHQHPSMLGIAVWTDGVTYRVKIP